MRRFNFPNEFVTSRWLPKPIAAYVIYRASSRPLASGSHGYYEHVRNVDRIRWITERDINAALPR
jgi:hypothetical protein